MPSAGVWRHWESKDAVITQIAKADEKGEFSLTNIELPGPWLVSVLAPPAGDVWLEIKLAAVPVRRVRGRVLDARGSPAAKVALTFGQDTSSPIAVGAETEVDESLINQASRVTVRPNEFTSAEIRMR